MECVLSLQDWRQAVLQGSHSPHLPGYSPAMRTMASPRNPYGAASTPVAAPLAAASAAQSFSFTPAANAVVSRNGPVLLPGNTDGLDYLMQSCTHMLKTRMGIPATPLPSPPNASTAPSDIALDAVGPVLETVLSNLTSEYERRLLAKDQEHKQQRDMAEGLRRQVAALESEAARWRQAAESKAHVAAAAAAVESEGLRAQERAEYERLRSSEAALMSEIATKHRELKELEDAAVRFERAANAELAQLRAELERYNGMEVRYKTVREENRQLYNLVQDLRGSIRVFCRVRPRGATGDGSQCVMEVGEDGALAAYSAKHSKWHEFKFDRVFGETSRQEEIYEETKPLVRSVLDGFNVCIFAYGQTGSGKTHTMSGVHGDGINFRALEDLFDQREERSDEVGYTIRVQLIEIYNEVIRDLLVSEGDAHAHHKSLSLVASRGSGNNLPEATQIVVESAAEVAHVMERGSRNRAVAETEMNERSSRSHQVLTVIVEGHGVNTHARTLGCLHLIDLAGSERISRSGAVGQQLIEAQHINKSLTALGCVMQALAQKRDHVPFRDSKLTQLLADSLSGHAKSMMFMHIAPEESSVSESLSTLNFGKGVTEITLGAAKRNVESGAVWEAREMKDKLAAARKDAAEERDARMVLEQEVAELRAQVQALSEEERPPLSFRSSPSANDGLTIRAHRPSNEYPNSTGLSRPPQVGRLNLGKLSLGGASSVGQPHYTPERSLIPSSARTFGSKIPTPLSGHGSLTARTSIDEKRSPLSMMGAGETLTSRSRCGSNLDPRPSNLKGAPTTYSGLARTQSGLSSGSVAGARKLAAGEAASAFKTAARVGSGTPNSSGKRWM